MRNIVFGLMAVCVLSGCAFKPSGMNGQRSAIRGLGDSAVTVSMDSIQSDADAAAVRVQVKEIALAVQAFLKDGKVADLTIPAITDQLRKLIPVDYQFLLDIMIAQIQGVTVNVDKIGPNNVERINSVCVGLINGCDLYGTQYRPVAPVATVTMAAAIPDATAADKSVSKKAASPKAIKAFGVALKKRCR